MMFRLKRFRIALVMAVAGSLLLSVMPAAAAPIGNDAFTRTWARTDKPVKDQQISRTWMWGPEANTGLMQEAYAEAQGGTRTVQYFDKSRMEISHDPNANQNSIWYVTNGLLANELITGQMQVGDAAFEDRMPAEVNIAGDSDDAYGPTYAAFSVVTGAPAYAAGHTIVNRIDRTGFVRSDPQLAQHGVTAAQRVTVPGIDHQVASPFWAFMNSQGLVYENGQTLTANLFNSPYYATGYPITEAYWANVKVDRTYKDVLMQCFERRCLTYTPQNDAAWQVEAGNVGKHYHAWRYEQWHGGPPAIGATVHNANLSTWDTLSMPGHSYGAPSGSEYHVTVSASFAIQWHVTAPSDISPALTNYHASVELKSLTPNGQGPGCLIAPFVDGGGVQTQYQFCIDRLGSFSGWVEKYDANDNWLSTAPLLSYRSSVAGKPWTEWNTLGVTVQGSQLWFYVNGDLIGQATLSGASSSRVGFSVLNVDDTNPIDPLTFAFRNLTVRSIGQ